MRQDANRVEIADPFTLQEHCGGMLCIVRRDRSGEESDALLRGVMGAASPRINVLSRFRPGSYQFQGILQRGPES